MPKESNNVCEESLFERLFMKLAPELRSFLYYKFRDLERAEDIIQEAFVILWNNCLKVLPSMAKSYLYKVSQNQFLKLLDKDKVRQKHLELQTDFTNIEDPDFELRHQELSQQLSKAIDQLPDGQREVFLLNRVDGQTYKEIAEQLEISVKAVEKRMSQALIKLRVICKNI
ncbi:MAG: RNA polymerase subunit sigma-70 [Flammeovirgaceae bacterium]|nr:RNA polymerase subunit sigma-70 [Flammeovirgaceae bacterium]MBE63150.1 RNA polymerase subunit sigma-70 [Flammeovirgaceae bacterium]MBR10345.1 RNA polymerase subunit sigma-70 [Rickettsiales bacterium]HCX23984.1 RNA polymerase subunit sigma-70 [Cytophagales bacterium]